MFHVEHEGELAGSGLAQNQPPHMGQRRLVEDEPEVGHTIGGPPWRSIGVCRAGRWLGDEHHSTETQEGAGTPKGPQRFPKGARSDDVEGLAKVNIVGQPAHIARAERHPFAELHLGTSPPEQIHPSLAAVGQRDPQMGKPSRDDQTGKTAARPEVEQVARIGRHCGCERLCVSNGAGERRLTERTAFTQRFED